MSMIKKYLKKNKYLQKKYKKALMNWDQNSIIREYKKTQNNSEAVTNENDKDLEKNISIYKKDKNIDNPQYYQKTINLLDNTPNKPTKFGKTKLSWNKWWIAWNV